MKNRKQLDVIKAEFIQNEITLQRQENILALAIGNGALTKEEFENKFTALRSEWIAYKSTFAKTIHQLSAEQYTHECMTTSGSLFYERVIIGASTAGTMVFDKLSHSARENTLVLNDTSQPSTWLKGGTERLMTQAEALQAPGFIQSSTFVLDEINEANINPYQYTRMQNLALAQMEKQNSLGMNIVNLRAEIIESKINFNEEIKWENPDYPYRILLLEHEFTKYVYTQHIDICVGLGSENHLSANQITPEVENYALKTGALIYDPQDSRQLRDGVIFYGASAGCGTMLAEVYQRKEFNLGSDIQINGWYTRSKGDFADGKMLTTLNRLLTGIITSERQKHNDNNLLRDGYTLKKVELSTGTTQHNLKITFQCTSTNEEIQVICPQLIIAIAQKPINLVSKIVKHIEFIPVITQDVPLGIISKDGSIIVWGAAASTKPTLACYLQNADEAEKIFQLVTAHAKTLPYESQVQPGILNSYAKIEKLAKYMANKYDFPLREETSREIYFKQINTASRHELVGIFNADPKRDKSYSSEELFMFADRIIHARSKAQHFKIKNLGGIHSADHLYSLKDKVPLDLLDKLRAHYYPHAEQFKVREHKTISTGLSTYGLFALGTIALGASLMYSQSYKKSA